MAGKSLSVSKQSGQAWTSITTCKEHLFNEKEGHSKAYPDCTSAKLEETVTQGQPNQEATVFKIVYCQWQLPGLFSILAACQVLDGTWVLDMCQGSSVGCKVVSGSHSGFMGLLQRARDSGQWKSKGDSGD